MNFDQGFSRKCLEIVCVRLFGRLEYKGVNCEPTEREAIAYLIMVAIVGSQFGIIFSAARWHGLTGIGNLRWYDRDAQVAIVAKKRRSPHFRGHFFVVIEKNTHYKTTCS